MNREDIIRLAREAGLSSQDSIYGLEVFVAVADDLIRFAALVAAVEREACAKLCENMATSLGESNIVGKAVNAAAFNIRSRNETTRIDGLVSQGLG